jgi:MOSC domain-containing protein YiiM
LVFDASYGIRPREAAWLDVQAPSVTAANAANRAAAALLRVPCLLRGERAITVIATVWRRIEADARISAKSRDDTGNPDVRARESCEGLLVTDKNVAGDEGSRDKRDQVSDGRTGIVVSVHVGQPRAVQAARAEVITAIWKHPVEGRVAVQGVNIDGDDQADRTVHGGRDKAVYAYALEEVQAWEDELERDLGEAAFGQNLTTQGIEVSGAIIGERWRIGSTVLEVAQPRQPCFKLALRIGEPAFVKRFAHASRPGAYLRIIEEGDIGAGDQIVVISQPDHGITCRMVSDAILRDPALIPLVVHAHQLPPELRTWMTNRIAN